LVDVVEVVGKDVDRYMSDDLNDLAIAESRSSHSFELRWNNLPTAHYNLTREAQRSIRAAYSGVQGAGSCKLLFA
jgi:hypothetical protein